MQLVFGVRIDVQENILDDLTCSVTGVFPLCGNGPDLARQGGSFAATEMNDDAVLGVVDMPIGWFANIILAVGPGLMDTLSFYG